MDKQINILFDVISEFYEGEYGYDMEENEFKEDLIENLKSDFVPIAASEFGGISEFSAETTYTPSQNTIIKDVYSVEYDESFQEKLYFKDIEAFQKYLYNATFDGLLEPEIDEEALINIVKSA